MADVTPLTSENVVAFRVIPRRDTYVLFKVVHVFRNALRVHINTIHPTTMYNVHTEFVDRSPDVVKITKNATDALTYGVHTTHVQRTACIALTRSFHSAIEEDKRVHAVPRTKCITSPDVYVHGYFGLSQSVAFHVVILHSGVRPYIAKADTTLVSAHTAIVDAKLKHPRCNADPMNASLSLVLINDLRKNTAAPSVCLPDVTLFYEV